jgi:Fe2+ or Zn2+ uptake regulation protein
MSRGLGRFQQRLLITVAAIEEGFPRGADEWMLQQFWQPPPPRLDHANIYRGLRALESRGLVWRKDLADYTPRCRCYHGSDDHHGPGSGYCRHIGRFRGCECRRYRPRPKHRPSWHFYVTEAGRQLIGDADTTSIVVQVRAWSSASDAVLQRAEATLRGN